MSEPELGGAKILIIDDVLSNLDILRLYLEPENYSLSFAVDGEKALSLASKLQPDILLLDIMMEPVDGIEVCRRLKAQAATRDIPVIFISALTETEDLAQGFKAGGCDYIAKPLQREQVLQKIQIHLQARYYQKSWHYLRQCSEVVALCSGGLSVAACQMDAQGKIITANVHWLHWLDQQYWLDTIPTARQTQVRQQWQHCLRYRHSFSVLLKLTNQKAQSGHFKLLVLPLAAKQQANQFSACLLPA
ncbi:response regulator [Candidatus Venteria ishoeyi]|uniref:response regulator n=1 Tax=Candidatus Venteria ishoeyi TaxID=1899563 RepID=UPI0025A60878|nr:response regulator [Candidatus Venteria ishoeyi]MDM8547846.1 response regulator [Candidatus Venteria ishoeyi]